MTNHLINENSPYLLQHVHNPVDWYPWGTEALGKARREDKPIFLSIGYAACHWCHVMAHESFEDEGIAAFMNQHFVNIKVDREERPDLDGIYMQAVVAMTGRGGWPMSVFITPDGSPFYAGTYFPPIHRFNMPSFPEVLQTIARLWKDDRTILLENSDQLRNHLQQRNDLEAQKIPLSMEIIDGAAANLAHRYDWKYGGWGQAPKFPQPMAVEFLLRKATRGDFFARDMAFHALEVMSSGGMYDVLGGGFARYSTDNLWRVPHFEKMLYDNAQLALVYLHAWLVSGERSFRRVCEETLDFITREMVDHSGGFYSSLDADSQGEEGKYYTWTLEEIHAALHDPQDIEFFVAAYDVTEAGNFEGKNVLQRALSDEELAQKFHLPVSTIQKWLGELQARLLATRATRVRPSTDDKILVSWNALALMAFAEASRYLGRTDYLTVAQRNARFIMANLFQENRLLRSWRNGKASHNAYLEDYSGLILALLALYQADANNEWYTTAIKLASEITDHFGDPDGGFFDTRDDHESLLYRPKDMQDNATPSGNALAACALLQLAAFEGRSDWRTIAEEMISSVAESIMNHPTAFAQWLQAADFALGPLNEVVIIGDASHALTQELTNVLWHNYFPRQVTARSALTPTPGSPAVLQNRPLVNDLPTAYVCRDFICLVPTNSPQEFAAQVAGDEGQVSG